MNEDEKYLGSLGEGIRPEWDRYDKGKSQGKEGATFLMRNPEKFSTEAHKRLVAALLGQQSELWGDQYRLRGSSDYRAMPWSKQDPTPVTIARPHVEVAPKSIWNWPWDGGK
jgi:hypothetical protein